MTLGRPAASKILPIPQDINYNLLLAGQNDRPALSRRVADSVDRTTITTGIVLPSTGDHWRGAIALHETLQADIRKFEPRITDGDHVWSL